jgi:hypothetical protein
MDYAGRSSLRLRILLKASRAVTRLGRPPSARKELRALLTEMLDDGTGQVTPALAGLLENLVSSTWNRYPAARRDSTLAPLHPSRGGAP